MNINLPLRTVQPRSQRAGGASSDNGDKTTPRYTAGDMEGLLRAYQEQKMRQYEQQQGQYNQMGNRGLDQLLASGGPSAGAATTAQMTAPAGGLASSSQGIGVAAVPGGVGNQAVAGGTTATGAGGPAGGGGASGLGALGPAAGFAALIGSGKLIENKTHDTPLGRGLLSGLGPSLAQIQKDPKLGFTTAIGVPFLNGWLRNDDAAEADPEWASLFGFG